MGEAKTRGTAEQRRQQAMGKMLDQAEVLIALSADAKGVTIQCLPRDEQPDQQSQAVILASFINANFGNLCETAMAAYCQHQAMGSDKAEMIRQVAPRSITTPEGGLAKDGPVLVDADGRALQ